MFCKIILAGVCVCFLLIKWGFRNFFLLIKVFIVLFSQGPPIIQELYTIQTARLTLVGEFVLIFCIVSGLPKPQVTWQKFGSGSFYYNYDSITINQVVKSRLFVYRAKFSDSGNYTCLAQNRNGNAKSNITLIVYGTLYIHTYM